MRIISSAGSETGDPISDGVINSTMDLFMGLVVELALRVDEEFRPSSGPRVYNTLALGIVNSCRHYLLTYLRAPNSRTVWHVVQSVSEEERSTGQWRVRYVVGHLIMLLDMTTGLLGAGGYITEPHSIRICEQIYRRYRDHYRREEPRLIRVAISRLMHCARGWALDPELENAYNLETLNREWWESRQSYTRTEMTQADRKTIDEYLATQRELASQQRIAAQRRDRQRREDYYQPAAHRRNESPPRPETSQPRVDSYRSESSRQVVDSYRPESSRHGRDSYRPRDHQRRWTPYPRRGDRTESDPLEEDKMGDS